MAQPCAHPDDIRRAADVLSASRSSIAFTGAGISVESGIPPFRGHGGVWEKVDNSLFEIRGFSARPAEAWPLIRDSFLALIAASEPNPAHLALARMEAAGRLDAVITQNIDGLHHKAGSRTVWEFHGHGRTCTCLDCAVSTPTGELDLSVLPPPCPACGGTLKPDFVFFGEPIPEQAARESMLAARNADAVLVVGSSGEVAPANRIPFAAKAAGAAVIEINPEPTWFTERATDVFLQGPAGTVLPQLASALGLARE
jgi:NAD-dependent deacetylase